jgi:membrane protein YfhO
LLVRKGGHKNGPPFFSTCAIRARNQIAFIGDFNLHVLYKIRSRYSCEELTAVIALAAMLVWFCDELIFAGKIPFFRDLGSYFYPIKFSVAEAFRAGELPLWDRRMAAGFPIAAGFQSAVFYPPSLVFYFFPFYAAIQFSFVFHYAVALSGSYFLFRLWNYPVFVAVIGSILFSFSGTIVSLTNLLNHFQSAVWLPWLIFLWERILRSERWTDFLVFSVVMLCQLLAGSPEIFALSVSLLVLDAVRLKREQRISGFVRAMVILSLATLVMIGLGMVQLLPTGELVMQSRRDQPIPAVEALAWSLRPSSLIGLLLPTLEADSSLSLGLRLLLAQGVPFLLSHYMGVIAILGVCAWFYNALSKERLVLISLLIGSLLLAFGRFTPVYPFLYDWVPLFRVMRFPEKYFYLTFALLVFAAVRGLRYLVDAKNSRAPGILSTSILLMWIIAYAISRWDPNLLAQFIQPPQVNPAVTTVNPTTVAAILFSLEKQMAVSLVFTVLFFLNRFEYLRPALLQSLLVLAVFVDLSIANKPLHFLRDKELIVNVSRVVETPPADHGRFFYYPPGNNLHPSYVTVHGNPSFEKATEIALSNLLPNAGRLYGFEYFQDIDALGRRSYTDFLNFINVLGADKRGKLLRALSVRYIVSFYPLDDVKGINLLREFPEHYSKLYEVPDAVPRAYIVSGAIYDANPHSTMRRLVSDEFDPMRQVILDTPSAITSRMMSQSSALITRYGNNQIQIKTQLSDAGILVFTDAYYPGWKVYIDGHEGKILRANCFFRAVELAAGSHTVEFLYRPFSFTLGLVVSLITAGFLVAMSIIGFIRRKKKSRESETAAYEPPVPLVAE